jgi:hypothetical protein
LILVGVLNLSLLSQLWAGAVILMEYDNDGVQIRERVREVARYL